MTREKVIDGCGDIFALQNEGSLNSAIVQSFSCEELNSSLFALTVTARAGHSLVTLLKYTMKH